jgi:LysR family transcriptional regulator, flagellar master operon regulator
MADPAISHRIVQPHLKAKRLSLIENAPEFSMSAYVVYPLDCDWHLFSIALEIMHGVAKPKATIRSSKTPPKRSGRAR